MSEPGFFGIHALSQTLLRIVAGLLFMPHGAQKLFGMFGGFGGIPHAAVPLGSMLGLAGVLEFFGGLLLVAGLFTRPVALLLSGEMAVAYFTVHLPRGLFPIANGGELALLYSFVFLAIAAAGGGSFSLDRVAFKR